MVSTVAVAKKKSGYGAKSKKDFPLLFYFIALRYKASVVNALVRYQQDETLTFARRVGKK